MTGEKVNQNKLISSNDKIVEEAAKLAKELHLGQTDKAGADYFRSHLTTWIYHAYPSPLRRTLQG